MSKPEEEIDKIGYVDIVFDSASNKLLNDILLGVGLKKDFTDAFHCTIAYSKKSFNFILPLQGEKSFVKGDKVISPISEIAAIQGFGNFKTEDGLNLHVELDCPFCESEFKRTKKAGASYDYDEYIPHITLMYDCKKNGKPIPIKYLDKLKKHIGRTLKIIAIRKQKLNTDWAKEHQGKK